MSIVENEKDSVSQNTDMEIRRINPLPDKVKESMFGVTIMEMTESDLKDRFGIMVQEKNNENE